jgi:signal transduction histidine kinase
MTDSQILPEETTWRAREAPGSQSTRSRELGPEVGRLVIAATRILLATIGLSSALRLMPPEAPGTTVQVALLAGYLAFALVVMVARLTSWQVDVRLRRIAPLLDRIVCVVMVVANPRETLLYIPFLLFLFLTPMGRPNRLWMSFEYLVLGAAILLHNSIADLVPWVERVDPQMLLLQFTLMLFIAITVLGFRLGGSNRELVDQWKNELYDISDNARLLPVEGIAEKLAERFGVADLVLCWKVDGDDQAHCIRAHHGELHDVDLQTEIIEAMLDPQAGGRNFLWDSSSGNALVDQGHQGVPVLKHFAQPTVPEILLAKGGRICALPIKSGSIVGYIYLLGIPRISETVLASAMRASEAVNAALDRYQLFEAWRDRAFANARLALSRDMHDSVLQTLAGLRMQVAALLKESASAPIEVRNERLNELQSIIAAEQACLRELLVDSDEVSGERIDLAGHLAQRIELLSRQWAVVCKLDIAGDTIWVASDVAIEVEFLVREAVSNAVQHAMATNITVLVAQRDGSLFITLRSNGEVENTPILGITGAGETIASRSLTRRLERLRGRAYADPIESGALLSMRIPVEFGADV